jgi:hypothetical protein
MLRSCDKLTNNNEEIELEQNNNIQATSFSNVIYHDDTALTNYLNNTLYVTMWFEVYEYLKTKENNEIKESHMEIMMHGRPMEEDLLDFITIIQLNAADNEDKACHHTSNSNSLLSQALVNTYDLFKVV